MSDETNPRDAGMRYYVGDPYLVIEDDSLLKELALHINGVVGEVEVHYGWSDRCGWTFDMTDDMGRKVYLPMSGSNMLAIVPIHLCDRLPLDEDESGAWFVDRPTLEWVEDRWYALNGQRDDTPYACDWCCATMYGGVFHPPNEEDYTEVCMGCYKKAVRA